MRIISVTNQKGGCGKTTTAINLTATLAVNDRKVLLIDLDPQAHATLGLNVKNELSIYNVLSKLTNRKAKLQDIIKPLGNNFDIAPSNIILSTLEQELAGEIGRESRLHQVLAEFKSDYDYIIIDCPPNLGILTINAIRAASEIIVPVEASRFSLEGLSQLTDIVHLVRDRLNHHVMHHVLVANFDSRLRHSFDMLDRIKSTFKNQLFSTIIHVNVKLKEAQSSGTHILNYDKYCRGSKDYFSLARELITAETASTTAPSAAAQVQPQKSKQTDKMPVIQQRMKEMISEHVMRLTEVRLSIAAPQAKEVRVAGDFNNWKLDDNSRMVQTNGRWTKTLNLNNGVYRYKFVIDGNWAEDPNNPNKETNPYGQMNSLLNIK